MLIRFRRSPVALPCDIKELYLKEIEESDRPYFRILRRDLDFNHEPDLYEFSRLVFGISLVPIEAQFVAQETPRCLSIGSRDCAQIQLTWMIPLTVWRQCSNGIQLF